MKFRPALALGGLAIATVPAFCGAPRSPIPFSPCEAVIATCDRPRPSCVVDSIRSAGNDSAPALRRPEDAALRLPPTPERSDPFYQTPEAENHEADSSLQLRPVPQRNRGDARAVLMEWQAAAESRLPATRAERLLLSRRQSKLSGFARDIALRLQGPIDAEALWSRFDWTVLEAGDHVRLTAVPRETLDRLSCERFEVRLDSRRRLVAIDFAGGPNRAGHRLVFREETRRTAAKVVTAAYEAAPTAPSELRTAQYNPSPVPAREPRLIREDESLDLPPAPTGSIGD